MIFLVLFTIEVEVIKLKIIKKIKRLKNVIITGASGGIGKDVALHFAENGWNVIDYALSGTW
jgi:FlaA1/EpsC-like NDP-sugar epimerase